ncbi:hypothetical protein [Arsukibacterium sp.]|uniref:hypothetical protein n=1 Tax=Arsukibacterium sp. TaxID=1977258 RepID=UPI002625E094|nr:hypothetical protein [Arsukibacterium sp.]
MKFVAVLMLSLLLSGCSKRLDTAELTQHFVTHQSTFKELADISCKVKSILNTKFYHYKIDTALKYPEHLAKEFLKINALLKKIDAKGIVIHQDGEPECSLYIPQWSFGFAGDGSDMGYSYQPAELNEYNPAIHLKENRNFREKIHFTKPLADNWYIEYRNIP